MFVHYWHLGVLYPLTANFDHGGAGFGEFNYAGEACGKIRKPAYFAVFLFSRWERYVAPQGINSFFDKCRFFFEIGADLKTDFCNGSPATVAEG